MKGERVSYMQSVIRCGTPNAETIEAITEVEEMKKDPHRKTYNSFAEILAEVTEEMTDE